MRLGLGPPEIVLTAEEPTPEWTQKLGQAPPIYSAEINYCLDGLALGQLTPGPVVMLAAFVGYHVAAITGAVVAAAVFLPSFALVALTIPILQRTRQHPWLCGSGCGSGFWGDQRPSLAHYVTGMGPMDGATAAGGRSCCLSSSPAGARSSRSTCSSIRITSTMAPSPPCTSMRS
jgi:hypothetical protein